jgi:hypothetical protein
MVTSLMASRKMKTLFLLMVFLILSMQRSMRLMLMPLMVGNMSYMELLSMCMQILGLMQQL